jgi:DNA-binding Xre family transcriptional regulator
MDINIGLLVKQRAKELRIGPTELGVKINTSKQNVYGIYKRKSIDTQLLIKLCNALNFDFFQVYSQNLHLSGNVNPEDEFARCLERKSLLEKENKVLENENSYLKKINTLLEERFNSKESK